MSDQAVFHGIVPPMLTPLNASEEIDHASTTRLVEHLVGKGVHGLWLLGTTGEFAALRHRERDAFLNTAVAAIAGRVPVIANVGDGSTQLAIENGKRIGDLNVDALAATPPYYYVYTPDEVADHYRALADALGRPLFVYNIPQTVKLNVDVKTVFQLAKEGVVVGIKDSSAGQANNCRQLAIMCRQAGIPLSIFMGGKHLLDVGHYMGVAGSIAGVFNIVPAWCLEAYEAGRRGEWERAAEAQSKVVEMVGQLERIPKLKAAAKVLGLISHSIVTKPFAQVPFAEEERIKATLERAGLLPVPAA